MLTILRVYALVKLYGRALVRSYYHVHSSGTQVEEQGPMILVSNHSGGLVDGGLIWFICSRNPRFIAKYTLFKMPFLRHIMGATGAIPVYRKKDNVDTNQNRGSFDAIHEELARGGAIGMFPEGEGGSAPGLRQFKTGAARMALGALAAKDWNLDVSVQPVGVYYDDRDRYRSNIFAWIGEPINFKHLRELYEQSPIKAARQATEEIRAALANCVVQYKSHGEAPAMVMAADLIPHRGRQLPERVHSCVAAMQRLKEVAPRRAKKLKAGLDQLSEELQQIGIRANDLDQRPGLGTTTAAVAMLAVTFLLRWIIWIAWLPVLVPAQVVSRRKAPPDKVVTFQLFGSTFISPIWLLCSGLWLGSTYGLQAGLSAVAGLGISAFCAGPVRDGFLSSLAIVRGRFEGGARGERNLRLLKLRNQLTLALTRRSNALQRLNRSQDSQAG